MTDPSTSSSTEHLYHPEADVENLEEYIPGGFHPTTIEDTFCDGRYKIVHKLGFGGYSTIWLAHDQQLQRYVSLKILVASASGDSIEGDILRLLQNGDSAHPGRQFVPSPLDQFTFQGPNGQHLCLVGVPYGCSISKSKEDSVYLMFPVEAARSAAAQLIMGLSYLHACGICHGDLHLGNFLLRIPNLDSMSTADLYNYYGKPDDVCVRRVDGQAPEPHAPSHAIYPMVPSMAAHGIFDPEIVISDYGTYYPCSGCVTPGVNLYELLGERPLFETFAWDRDDIIGEMVNTLGRLPARWWDSWVKRGEFFQPDGKWISDFRRISTPVFRPLRQRLWDMGRAETPETCQWDVAGGELQALEDLLRGMLAFEPTERLTVEQLVASEYMTRWALPARFRFDYPCIFRADHESVILRSCQIGQPRASRSRQISMLEISNKAETTANTARMPIDVPYIASFSPDTSLWDANLLRKPHVSNSQES
ncbi:hypothetical protein AAE478_003280 [Parahypoxylon ruwenzoriense]